MTSITPQLTRTLGVIFPIAFWYLLTDGFGLISPTLLPSLSETILFVESQWQSGLLLQDSVATLSRWLCGCAFGLLSGIFGGFLLSLSASVRNFTSASLEFFRALPVTALLPLFLLLFGVGDTGKIAMISFPTFLLLTSHVDAAIRNCSRTRHETLRSFGATRTQCTYLLLLPEVTPALLLGIRLSLALGLVVAIVSEMFIGTEYGLGQKVYESYMMNSVTSLYAHILIVGLFGFLSASIVQIFEHQTSIWKENC